MRIIRNPNRSLSWFVLPVYLVTLIVIVLIADLGLGNNTVGVSLGSMIQAIPAGDKIGHFLLFGMLAYLANVTFARSKTDVISCFIITGCVALVVLAEELSQILLPHRNFDMMDLCADFAGIVVFSSFAYRQKRGRLAA